MFLHPLNEPKNLIKQKKKFNPTKPKIPKTFNPLNFK